MKHLNTFSNQQTFLSIKEVCLTWQSMRCVIEVQCFIVPCHKIMPPFNIFVFCKDKTGVMWSIGIVFCQDWHNDFRVSIFIWGSLSQKTAWGMERDWTVFTQTGLQRQCMWAKRWIPCQDTISIWKSSDDDDEFPWLHLMSSIDKINPNEASWEWSTIQIYVCLSKTSCLYSQNQIHTKKKNQIMMQLGC